MLYIFGCMPSSGKSVLSTYLARTIHATHLRIDSIEQGLKNFANMQELTIEGYVAAYAVAADNLRLGHSVVAESVNPIDVTRKAWRKVAQSTNKAFCEIEVICSDSAELKARYQARIADIDGLVYPPWSDQEKREYQPWPTADMVIDTSGRTIAESKKQLLDSLKGLGFYPSDNRC